MGFAYTAGRVITANYGSHKGEKWDPRSSCGGSNGARRQPGGRGRLCGSRRGRFLGSPEAVRGRGRGVRGGRSESTGGAAAGGGIACGVRDGAALS